MALTDQLIGDKPLTVNITIDYKSAALLGMVLFLAIAAALIAFKKV